MTAEPLSRRADVLACMSRALTRSRAGYDAAFERIEAKTLSTAGRLGRQAQEAPRLLAELLALPWKARRGVVAVDERFHSAPLAALLLDEAREQADQAEDLAQLAHFVLDRVDFEEAKPLKVSAYVVVAEVARRRQDEQTAESALAAASSQLWEWSLSHERAEYCLAVARLRKDQARFDEAFALANRAGELYEALGEDVAAAEAFLALGGWSLDLGCRKEALAAFSSSLCLQGTPTQVLAGVQGLAQALILLGEPADALAIVRTVRRERLSKDSYEYLVLGTLEGQMLLQRAVMRAARRELYGSFHGLLRMGKTEEALHAGLALLLSGAHNAADLARQLTPFVSPRWPDLKAALAEVITEGHLPAERRGIVAGYLSGSGAGDGL